MVRYDEHANLTSQDKSACSVLRGERHMQALFRIQGSIQKQLHANLASQDRSACSVLRGERYMQALSEFRAQPKTHLKANLVSNDRFACSVLRGEHYMQALSEFRAQTLHLRPITGSGSTLETSVFQGLRARARANPNIPMRLFCVFSSFFDTCL